MKKFLTFLICSCVVVVSVTLSAQGGAKPAAGAANGMLKSSWKCTPPNPMNAIPVPDEANHAYVVQQSTCTSTAGDEVMGVKHKDGTGVEFVEAMGNNGSGHGIFTANMANGDKVVYSYTFKGTMANGKFQSGSSNWTVKSGTGKFKGITGKGTCKAMGTPDGGATHDCSGTYGMPKM